MATYRFTCLNPKNGSNTYNNADGNDLQVRIVGIVGKDKFGPRLKENLANHEINVEEVCVLSGQLTKVANILVKEGTNGKQIMLYLRATFTLESTNFMMLESLGGGLALNLRILQLEIRRDTIVQAIETAN